MTTTFRPSLVVQLTSMRPPTAIHARKMALYDHTEAATKDLVVYPGESSEMLVQLKNQSDRPITWSLDVKGDFPLNWCRLPQVEPQDLVPNQSVDVALSFEVPADFFEHQRAIHAEQTRSRIDYQSQIQIYVHRASGSQLVSYEVFTLHVRPSSTYLNFLPALYQNADFMQRFLTLFEQTFDPAVQTLDTLWAYLDPLTAPEAFLPFLSRWVAWTLDSRWDSRQQRRLIRNAIALYRWHGTRYGLRFYLALYTGLPLDEQLPEAEKHISIEEVFDQGFVMGKTQIGQDSMIGGGQPYHFIVRLRPEATDQIDESLIRSIIEQYKPAFCTYELIVE